MYKGSPGDFDSKNNLYYPTGTSINKIEELSKIKNLSFLKEEKEIRAVKLYGDNILATLYGMKSVGIWDLVNEKKIFTAEAKTDIHKFLPYQRDDSLTIYFTDSEGHFGYFKDT